MANRINKIISTKANTLYAMKNLIKRQALRKCISLELKTSGAIKIKSAQRLWKNLVAAESSCEAPLRRKTV